MPEKSMNVFTVEVMDELEQIIDATVADEAVKGVGLHVRQSLPSPAAPISP
jgi:enoyl-CoA hydratase/carnithine racemase